MDNRFYPVIRQFNLIAIVFKQDAIVNVSFKN